MNNVVNLQAYKIRRSQEKALDFIRDEFKNNLHFHSGAQITNEQYETLVRMIGKGFRMKRIRFIENEPVIVMTDETHTSLIQPDGYPVTYER